MSYWELLTGDKPLGLWIAPFKEMMDTTNRCLCEDLSPAALLKYISRSLSSLSHQQQQSLWLCHSEAQISRTACSESRQWHYTPDCSPCVEFYHQRVWASGKEGFEGENLYMFCIVSCFIRQSYSGSNHGTSASRTLFHLNPKNETLAKRKAVQLFVQHLEIHLTNLK